jgi:hypothetical protein
VFLRQGPPGAAGYRTWPRRRVATLYKPVRQSDWVDFAMLISNSAGTVAFAQEIDMKIKTRVRAGDAHWG